MTHEEQIAKLTEMLAIQQKLQETAVDMLKPAVDAAYLKGYTDAMGWKTQNHLEHLSQRQPLTDEDLRKLADKHLYYQPEGYLVSGVFDFARAIEAAHGIKENT